METDAKCIIVNRKINLSDKFNSFDVHIVETVVDRKEQK